MKIRRYIAALLVCAVMGGIIPGASVTSAPAVTASAWESYDELGTGKYSTFTYTKYADHIGDIKIEEGAAEIEIPGTIDGLPVDLSSFLLNRCTTLEKITVADNDDYCAEDGILYSKNKDKLICYPAAKSGKSYTVPESVTYIDPYAFPDTCKLEVLNICKNAEIGMISTYDGCKFPLACSNLKEINIEEGHSTYVSVKGLVFNKEDMSLVRYPAGSDAEKYTVPAEITSIGDYAFENSSSLKEVIVGDHVTKLGNWAFTNCKALETAVIGDGIEELGLRMFYGCSSLSSVTLGNNIKAIWGSVFDECTNLKSITLPAGVERVLSSAPSPGTGDVSSASFAGSCIEEILVDPANESFTSIEGVLYSKDGKKLVVYPPERKGTQYVIPDGTTAIADCAFMSCDNLQSVMMPDTVEGRLGLYVFGFCNDLRYVRVSNNVTELYCTFYGCKRLGKIELGDKLESVLHYSFSGTAINYIEIPESAKEVIPTAFDYCPRLSNVIFNSADCSLTDYWGDMGVIFSNSRDNVYNPHFNGVIYGHAGSTIEEYAKLYNVKFVDISKKPERTEPLAFGDLNGDEKVDSSDASNILAEYAKVQTGRKSELDPEHVVVADVNGDGTVDSSDASTILGFYSYSATGGKITDLDKWIEAGSPKNN